MRQWWIETGSTHSTARDNTDDVTVRWSLVQRTSLNERVSISSDNWCPTIRNCFMFPINRSICSRIFARSFFWSSMSRRPRSERLELHVSPSSYWLQSFIHHLQFNTSMPNIERSANQVTEYFQQLKNPSSASSLSKSSQQQLTPINDSNPISPLSVTSQTSASDSSTSQQQEQHRYIYDFSKLMLNSYYSTCYWNKADRLMRDKSLKGNRNHSVTLRSAMPFLFCQ